METIAGDKDAAWRLVHMRAQGGGSDDGGWSNSIKIK